MNPGASGWTANPRAIAAAGLLAALLGLAIWWPLKAGAFFPTVFLPGALVLYGVVALLLAGTKLLPELSRWNRLALGGLIGLTAWTAISIAWTPARDIAFEDAQRTAIYPAALFAGLMLGTLLGGRRVLALAPWAVAAVVVAAVTYFKVTGAASPVGIIDQGTLEFPFGYRNANALFFLLSALVVIGGGGWRRLEAPWHAAAGAIGAVSLTLAVLCQSRGSIPAAAVGFVTLVILSPDRRRLTAISLAAIIPTVALMPELVDPYTAEINDQPTLPEMQQAIELLPFAAVGGALLGTFAGPLSRIGRSSRDGGSSSVTRKWIGAGLALVAVAGAAGALVVAGDPFSSDDMSGSEDGGGLSAGRFTFTGDLGRTNFYAVAFDQFEDAPLIGDGSGSFRTRYALERETGELPRDAHSLVLETLGELGLIGLLLLVAAGVGMLMGAWSNRRLGDERSAFSAIAIAIAAAFTAQASVDWFSSFPALVFPVCVLLGAAAATRPKETAERSNAGWRIGGIVLLVVVTAIAVPTFISDRDTVAAANDWREDPEVAFDRLQRATDLNPFADEPLQVKAQIERELGRSDQALAAIEAAIERQPEEFRSYVIAATILAKSDPSAARAQLAKALELNPLSPEAKALRTSLNSPETDEG